MYVIKLSLSLIDTLHRRNGQFFHRWNLTTTILKSERPALNVEVSIDHEIIQAFSTSKV